MFNTGAHMKAFLYSTGLAALILLSFQSEGVGDPLEARCRRDLTNTVTLLELDGYFNYSNYDFYPTPYEVFKDISEALKDRNHEIIFSEYLSKAIERVVTEMKDRDCVEYAQKTLESLPRKQLQ